MTKLSGTLPGGDNNGLNGLARALTADPHKTAIIVAVVDCKSITIDTDTGDKVATVRIRRVEPIDPQDTDAAQRLLVRGLERRTGAVMLPMDLEDELDKLFANLVDLFDMETGELVDNQPEDATEATDEAEQLPEPEVDAEALAAVDEALATDAAALGFTESAEILKPPAKKTMAEELDETIAKAEAEFKPKLARKSRAKPKAEPAPEPTPEVDDDDGPPWPE